MKDKNDTVTAHEYYLYKKPHEDYRCHKCGTHGSKMWRGYNSFSLDLRCATCALKEEGINVILDIKGTHPEDWGQTDKIGWLVPAVPDESDYAYWSYTSVPSGGIEWWQKLPTYPCGNQALELIKEVSCKDIEIIGG